MGDSGSKLSSRLPNLSNLPLTLFALSQRIVTLGQNVTWSTFHQQCRDVPSHFSSPIVSNTFHRQDNVIAFFQAQPASETLHASNPIANSCTLSISQSSLSAQKFSKTHFHLCPICVFSIFPLHYLLQRVQCNYTHHTHTQTHIFILICFNNSHQDMPDIIIRRHDNYVKCYNSSRRAPLILPSTFTGRATIFQSTYATAFALFPPIAGC